MSAVRQMVKQAPIHEPEPPRPLKREVPPGEHYPVESLGAGLAAAVREIQRRTLTPLAIPAQSVLATAALAAQGHRNIILPTGQERPLSCFFSTVAGTGERKTSADDYAIEPVRGHELLLQKQYRHNINDYQNALDAWEKQRADVLKQAKTIEQKKEGLDKLGPKPSEPLKPFILHADPTSEGIQKSLLTCVPSIGIFSSEGGVIVGGHAMKSENKLRTGSTLSLLWDGQPGNRTRSGDGVTGLNGKRVSMHLLMQPEVASILFSDSLLDNQGLFSRILIAAPESTVGTRFVDPDKQEFSSPISAGLVAYHEQIQSLFRKPLPIQEGTINDLKPTPIQMSSSASRNWWQFVNHIEKLVAPGKAMEPIRGLANKLPEHAARLASVLLVYDNPDAAELNDEYLERGIELSQYYANELLRLRLYGESDPQLELAQRVLDWLISPAWGEELISLPDIYQYSPTTQVRSKTSAEPIVAILADHGHLVRVEGGAEVKGNRRKDVWRIVRG